MKGKFVFEQVADRIWNGERVEIRNDPFGFHEGGGETEGPWYISTDTDSWCYYRTREDARDVIRSARELVRKWKQQIADRRNSMDAGKNDHAPYHSQN